MVEAQNGRIAQAPDSVHRLDPAHYMDSSLREKVLEHIFIGELLRALWRRGARDAEVLRAEVDRGGYDLVLKCNGALRYVQFKSSHRLSATAEVSVSLSLAKKPGGCVLWVRFDQDALELGPFLWFGGEPGQKLPPLGDRIARHAKGDSSGVKKEKPNHRILTKAKFEALQTMDDVILWKITDTSRRRTSAL